MPKLTVFFKYKAIDSYLFDNGLVQIGSDETNHLRIESLAVAPFHAAITYSDGINSIKQMDENFPLLVNGKPVNETVLNDNDKINLGKHELLFHSTESFSSLIEENRNIQTKPTVTQMESENTGHIGNAGLQVMSGANIGKLLPLKKAMTRIGNSGSGVVVIARRKDGYFVSALENSESISVNKQPINDGFLRLNNNDVLHIGTTSLQFFFS
ncbi:hypothetical protein JCM14076_07410 [Methylosoma difficile]